MLNGVNDKENNELRGEIVVTEAMIDKFIKRLEDKLFSHGAEITFRQDVGDVFYQTFQAQDRLRKVLHKEI